MSEQKPIAFVKADIYYKLAKESFDEYSEAFKVQSGTPVENLAAYHEAYVKSIGLLQKLMQSRAVLLKFVESCEKTPYFDYSAGRYLEFERYVAEKSK